MGTAPTHSSTTHRDGVAAGQHHETPKNRQTLRWQIAVYLTVMAAVIASRFLDFYNGGVSWSPIQDWKYLVVAAIIALAAFPVVYRKAQRVSSDPVLVRLGVIFAAGMGSEKILSTIAGFVK